MRREQSKRYTSERVEKAAQRQHRKQTDGDTERESRAERLPEMDSKGNVRDVAHHT